MIGRRCALTATVVLLLLATSLAMACEPTPIGKDAARIDGQNFVLVWRVEPAPLTLGEFFAVLVSACERSAQRVSRLKIDATMPAHNHGMNYLPTISADGGGKFTARGLLLHMPGRWELAFDVASEAAREQLRANVDLK
jgi:hypothetical protein